LAFSGESRITQIWMAPFDARSGKLIGTGAPATSPGTQAWVPTLSPDGEQLAFSGNRGGVQQIWQKSLASAQETPITASDSYGRAYPVWSPDGHYLAYPRWSLSRPETSIVIWSRESHEERVIVDGGEYNLYGWMPNGQKLIMSKWNDRTQKAEIWLFPLGEAPPEKIAATPEYFLFQGQCSSDGRWIVFEAIRDVPSGRESTIYVVPATGGQWIRITNSKQWDDKPRWSPDGRTIYFVSGRGGFYNVWGVRFDSANGRAKGAPFRVTNFDSPAFMVPSFIPDVGLSIAAGRLAITTSQSSGGIWVLNNIDE
jgi:Tol biopolymer transport system component